MDENRGLTAAPGTQEQENHSGNGRPRTPELIRADIEHTRAELNETVIALRDRVSAKHMKKEIVGFMRGAASGTVDRVKRGIEEGVRKVSETAARRIGDNGRAGTLAAIAVPVIMIGLGAGISLFLWRRWIRPGGRRSEE
ncbi:MAG TPA: DUF3618 domain-containing protein [Thermodesulfobacteriota bacterium]|nr:DUF3618 domain-containing protein [Thermodesulfobacteriota bacterium]